MRTEHIIELLDGRGLAQLTDDEVAAVERHAAECRECETAFRSSQIAATLITARASQPVEVPPFFSTRVMAALRERRGEEQLDIAKLWRAAWSLVTAMAAIVVLLIGATIREGQLDRTDPELSAARTIYSPDWDVLVASSSSGEELSDEQMVGVLYESEVASEQ